MCLSFQKISIMLINKKSLDGSTFHYTNKRLGLCAGSTSCFTTFRPERFPNEDIIYRLLRLLYNLPICCFMNGTFVKHRAGIFNDYDRAMLFVALTENPLLKTIFQKHYRVDYINNFNVNEFKFSLIGFRPGYDIFRYIVSYRDFSMTFLIVGIDVTTFCNPLSNVDFVHFFWGNYHRFNFKKYAITILPSPPSIDKPQMLCLQYYRAKSDGWKNSGICDDCGGKCTQSTSVVMVALWPTMDIGPCS
jgi:hypothetical protein